jgi:hypothetical protein
MAYRYPGGWVGQSTNTEGVIETIMHCDTLTKYPANIEVEHLVNLTAISINHSLPG